MITIYIENKAYTVKEGQNLLQACLSLGFDIPYFCWHPAMHSVGACRQCAVKEFKDDKDTRGRVIMSCMTAVREGMRISIEDAEAKSFRKNIVELLMLNHPHDCPVCDEGGECHLQDMTVMTGHVYRRSRFNKRTYPNQDLGPFIAHEMNRCIQCYRCVRFYRDYAGGRDLDVFAIHDNVYFGRQKDGTLENEFSGNLVEVCPTGVFTDKTFQKHYSRKWDLQSAPSVCVHCGVGCNTVPGERYGELRRIRTRYNGEVNGYFLCDRGRFGYEFVNSPRRIREPRIAAAQPAGDSAPCAGTCNQALSRIKDILSNSRGIVGIGSPRASLETNFALRELVGPENFCNGMARQDSALAGQILGILRNGPARSPSLRDVQSCDAILVLGEDLTNTAPLLALAVRQAARQRSLEHASSQRIPLWDDAAVRNASQGIPARLSVAAPYATRLDDIAGHVYHGAPEDLARFGMAVAHELNSDLPAVEHLREGLRSRAAAIAGELRNAKRPLVVSGTGCFSRAVIEAAANIAWSLCTGDRQASLAYALPECNSLGLALFGGFDLETAVRAVADGKADTVVVAENDLYGRMDRASADGFLAQVRHLIVIDHVETQTAARSEVSLPAATFAESDGDLVNTEGRAQRFYQVLAPQGEVQESWRWLRDIMTAAGMPGGRSWEGLDDVISSLATTLPELSAVPDIAPPAGFRIAGMKMARQPHRYSGRTALSANRTVFEPRPPRDQDSPLAFSMEGFPGQPPSPLITHFWRPAWNSPQAINKFQSETGGPLRGGDPGKRLIEPSSAAPRFFRTVPPAFVPAKDTWLLVPLHQIFGSEQLSSIAAGIAERTPRPFVGFGPEAARDLDIAEGEEVQVRAGQVTLTAPARYVRGLPDGVAGLPYGIPGMPAMTLPAQGRITRSEGKQ
jgi:NADH-quinone oxidoreductase subunit G